MRGSETVSTTITFSSAGGGTTGQVTFRGVNASGVDDGTKYVLNGTTGVNVVQWDQGYTNVENLEVNGGAKGIYKPSYSMAYYCNFTNIHIHDCSSHGFEVGTSGSRSWTYNRVLIEDCGGYGASGGSGTAAQCVVKGNGAYGWYMAGGHDGMQFVDCLFLNNAGVGVRLSHYSGIGSRMYNCVIDGNTTDGVYLGSSGTYQLYNCRITNNGSEGIHQTSTTPNLIFGCVMPGSGQDRENGAANILGSAVLYDCDFAITDTDAGYVDPSAGNFQLASTATKRNASVSVDANTQMFSTAGITPDASGGSSSGGGFRRITLGGGMTG